MWIQQYADNSNHCEWQILCVFWLSTAWTVSREVWRGWCAIAENSKRSSGNCTTNIRDINSYCDVLLISCDASVEQFYTYWPMTVPILTTDFSRKLEFANQTKTAYSTVLYVTKDLVRQLGMFHTFYGSFASILENGLLISVKKNLSTSLFIVYNKLRYYYASSKFRQKCVSFFNRSKDIG